MALKTREKLIEVARQLFNKKGVEHTTMNDIATASDKGRRTIYTYFKNKRDIYNAVIERESETLIAKLREIASSSLSPIDKLRSFLERRISLLGEFHGKRDNLMSIFSFDTKRAIRIRRLAISKVNEILENILNEGITAGSFDPEQAQRLPATVAIIISGIDAANMHEDYETAGTNPENDNHDIVEFIISGIKKT